MAEKKYRFKGHESFILREGWMDKGLEAIYHNPRLFSENAGADELGVGVNMAKSLRYWMRCAGLIQESKKEVYLSNIGKIIYKKDPYLEDFFSLWLLHCNIAGNEKQATVWNLFFNTLDEDEFRSDYLKWEILRLAANLPEVGKVAEHSVFDDCDTLLRMYTRQKEKDKTPEEKNTSPFSSLRLLEYSDGIYTKQQPELNKLPAEIIWYLMMEKRDAVSIEDLLAGKNSPGKLLNLKMNGLLELLEQLAVRGIIEINRTAGLDMVYLQTKKKREEIIESYYK